MKTGVIVQSRINSTRLYGKIIKKVLDKTILEYLIERLKKIQYADDICIAFSDNSDDIKIKKIAEKLNLNYFKGSEYDVLSRHYLAAKKFSYDNIVRISSDCPLIDPGIIDQIIFKFNKNKNVDYLSNALVRSFPLGMEAEIFSFKALEFAYNKAHSPYDREHVTPYIKNFKNFKKLNLKYKKNLSNYRLTLDTEEDFILIKKIIEELYPLNINFNLFNIIKFIDNDNSLIGINSHIRQIT